MHLMMPAEPNCHKNMMAQNFQLHFYPILSLKHKENGSTIEQEAYGVYYDVTKMELLPTKVQIP